MSQLLQGLAQHLQTTCIGLTGDPTSWNGLGESLDYWVVSSDLQLCSQSFGVDARIANSHSDCRIKIGRFHGDIRHLNAQISAWLSDQNPERFEQHLADPRLLLTLIDQATAINDLELQIRFIDAVQLSPEVDGPITWNGQTWQLADLWTVDTATTVDSVTAQAL